MMECGMRDNIKKKKGMFEKSEIRTDIPHHLPHSHHDSGNNSCSCHEFDRLSTGT
jgi:hypothetical protein